VKASIDILIRKDRRGFFFTAAANEKTQRCATLLEAQAFVTLNGGKAVLPIPDPPKDAPVIGVPDVLSEMET
jgi:hypothetical protein